jgi:NADH-quinone oxidoreductase subunit E
MSYAPSPAALDRMDRTIARYPERPAALLPVLHIIQEEAGFVSGEAARWVAARLGLEAVRVREVLSFYTMFRTAPAGRHTLRVCRNLSCHLAGAEDLLSFIRQKLGIGPDETTPDGAFTLVTAECLGHCDHAPCLQIDGVDHGPVGREAAAALIEELQAHGR